VRVYWNVEGLDTDNVEWFGGDLTDRCVTSRSDDGSAKGDLLTGKSRSDAKGEILDFEKPRIQRHRGFAQFVRR